MRNPANHHGHREEELSGSVARVPARARAREGKGLRYGARSTPPGKPVHGDGPLRLSYPCGASKMSPPSSCPPIAYVVMG